MKFAEKVGDRLRRLREQMGITQRELARRLDMPYQSLSNYERGYREADYETLKLFSDYYHVTIDYIIKGTDINQDDNIVNPLCKGKIFNIEELINLSTIILDNIEVSYEEYEEMIIFLRSRRIMNQLKNKK
jgi:transcriptional regulator with XRE-family HTH domain